MMVIRYEDDAEFFDRSSFRYYAAGLSAIRVHDNATAVTSISLRVSKSDDDNHDDAVAYQAALKMARNIFPGKHFFNHQAVLQRIDVNNFKDIE